MNTQLLQQVQQHIAQHPERFCAAQWAWARNAGAVIEQDAAPVDFRCCIAGHVLLLSRRFDEAALLRHSVHQDDGYLGRCAQDALGLTDEQRHHLFYPSLWTDPYRSDYYLTATREDEARVCADFLAHFLAAHEGDLTPATDRPALTHQVYHLARPTRSVAAFR
jgi:hypothetical protein